MDKDLSKKLFRSEECQDRRLADGAGVDRGGRRNPRTSGVVKPSKQGSTVGLTVVKKREELDAGNRGSVAYDDEVMIEQFIPGRELTVGVLGDIALPVGEIKPEARDLRLRVQVHGGHGDGGISGEAVAGGRQRRCSSRRSRHSGRSSSKGYARIDFRLSSDDEEGGVLLSRGKHVARDDRAQSDSAGCGGHGNVFPELCERDREARRE